MASKKPKMLMMLTSKTVARALWCDLFLAQAGDGLVDGGCWLLAAVVDR